MTKRVDIIQVNNNFRHDACPLCRSLGIRLVGNLGYRDNVNFSTHTLKLAHIPELWRCDQCESWFVQNIIDAETAKMLYSTGEAGNRWSTVAFDEIKTHEVLARMRMIFRPNKTVLDVGSNTGELLDFARDLGCRTTGIEFSSASRRLLDSKGHGSYSSFEESSDKYDVVTAFDLIEHLYDVPAFLTACREKLSNAGQLVILTGDIDSLSAKLSKSRWWYAQYPEHVVFPSRRYFSEFSGFRVTEWVSTYASIGYKYSIYRIGLDLLKGFFKGRKYKGLPSIGADHVLVELQK